MIRKLALSLVLALVALPAAAASLYVTEFVGAPPTSVYYQAVKQPEVTTQVLSIGGSSVQSAPFGSTTGIVRVQADAACHIVVNGSPTATSTSMKLTAGQTEYFVVTPGQILAVITD
jgi:hypothetical protein